MANSKKKKQWDIKNDEEVLNKESLIKSQEKNLLEFSKEKTQLSDKEDIYHLKMNTLQIVISKNEKELQTLERELDSRRIKNAQYQQQISDTEYKIELAQESIIDKNKQITQTEHQITSLKKRYTDLKRDYNTVSNNSDASSMRMIDLEEQLKNKKKLVFEIEAKLESQTKTLQECNDDAEKLFFDLVAEQKKESSLRKQKELNQEKIIALESEIRKSTEEISELQAKVKALESEIEIQDKSITNKKQHLFEQRSQYDKVLTALADKENASESNKIEISELTRRLDEVNNALLEKKNFFTTQENLVKNQIDEIRLTKKNVEDLENGIKTLEDEITHVEAKISSNKNVLSNQTANVMALRKQRDDLDSDRIYLKEELKIQVETKSVKEKEISDLSIEVHELKDKNVYYGDNLKKVNKQNQEHNEQLKNLKESQISLKNKLKHEKELLNEQTEYTNSLQTQLNDLEEEIINLNKESNSTQDLIEQRKHEIFKLDQQIKDSHYSISKSKENLQVLLHSSKEAEAELINRFEEIFEQKEQGALMSASTKEFLQTLLNNKEKREKVFLSTSATLTSLDSELSTLKQQIQSQKEKIRLFDLGIDQKNEEIERLTAKSQAIRVRVNENQDTITQHEVTSQNLAKTLQSLDSEYLSYQADEEQLSNKIDKLTKELHVQEQRRSELHEENQQKMKRIQELSGYFSELQAEEATNSKDIKNYTMNASVLTKDVKKLEECIADYEARVNAQKELYEQKNKVVKGLTSKNHIMIERIKRLETTLEEFEAKNKLIADKIQTQEAIENENNVKLKQLALEITETGADYTDIDELVEASKGLEVSIEHQIHSLQTALEKKFFNLSFIAPAGDLGGIKEFDANQMKLFEEVHNEMLQTVEDEISHDAEFYIAFDANKHNIRSSITISNLDNVYNDQAKRKFTPVTTALLKKYKQMGLKIYFRAKIKPNGTIDKIKLELNLPIGIAKHDTYLEA